MNFLRRMSSRALALADGRILARTAAAWAALAGLLFAWTGRFSLTAVATACGHPAPDVQFAPPPSETLAFLVACGEPGRAAWRDLQVVDLFYPIVGAAVLVVTLAMLLGRLAPQLAWLAFAPLLVALGDYTENASAWVLLAVGEGSSWAASTLQLGSAIKVIASSASWTAVIALLVPLVVARLRRRENRVILF